MAHWERRTNQVSMTEMIAPVIAIDALGERLRGTNTLVFIDSECVEGALIKGYSGKPDLDDVAGAFWALCIAYDVAPYVDRIPTDSNPADDPSRGRYAPLHDAGAVLIDAPPPRWLVNGTPWEDEYRQAP